MRGLKYIYVIYVLKAELVAPHVGAWIEIVSFFKGLVYSDVAPHVGAWIEISVISGFETFTPVAPHVGAWIEINSCRKLASDGAGRTPRGCVD